MVTRKVILVLSVTVILASPPSAAFEYNGRTWCQDTVQYLVNPAEPSITCSAADPQSFQSIIAAATAAWSVDSVTFLQSGTTSELGCVPGANGKCIGNMDGLNVASMGACQFDTTRTVLATAWWWYSLSGSDECCLTQVDICFNDNIDWWVDSSENGCSAPCYDLYTVALHEVGHWVSLGHEDDQVGGVPQIMNSLIYQCDFRGLTTDDVVGLGHACILRDYPVGARCYPTHYHGLVTGIDAEPPDYVDYLADNYPNPFNPATTIRYSVKESGHVSLKIYDVRGALVRTLVDERQMPQQALYRVEWDGRDDGGHSVASGVYFFRLVTNTSALTRKMVLLK